MDAEVRSVEFPARSTRGLAFLISLRRNCERGRGRDHYPRGENIRAPRTSVASFPLRSKFNRIRNFVGTDGVPRFTGDTIVERAKRALVALISRERTFSNREQLQGEKDSPLFEGAFFLPLSSSLRLSLSVSGFIPFFPFCSSMGTFCALTLVPGPTRDAHNGALH